MRAFLAVCLVSVLSACGGGNPYTACFDDTNCDDGFDCRPAPLAPPGTPRQCSTSCEASVDCPGFAAGGAFVQGLCTAELPEVADADGQCVAACPEPGNVETRHGCQSLARGAVTHDPTGLCWCE